MPALILIFTLALGSAAAFCQTRGWLWASRAGEAKYEVANDLAVDSQGNQYVVGEFVEKAVFGSVTLTSKGLEDIFVAKSDPEGNWLWAVRAGGWRADRGFAIALDGAGNVCLTGTFERDALFGAHGISSAGFGDVFVANIDSGGNWLWTVQAGGEGSDCGYGIAVDAAGSIVLTGSFEKTAAFGSQQLTSYGERDAFAAQLDSEGNWLWAVRAGGLSFDQGAGLALDSAGNAILSGSFRGDAVFGGYLLKSAGSSDVFVAKLDSSGDWLWAVQAGGTATDEGLAVALDSSGNAFLTGRVWGSAAFGSRQLVSEAAPGEGESIFVAKLDPAGNWLWAARAGESSDNRGLGIAADPAGNAYLIGLCLGDAAFGAVSLPALGKKDIFIAKLDSLGNWLWAIRAGGSGWDEARGIALDGAGNAYICGLFEADAAFGSCALSSSGNLDVCVAKLNSGK